MGHGGQDSEGCKWRSATGSGLCFRGGRRHTPGAGWVGRCRESLSAADRLGAGQRAHGDRACRSVFSRETTDRVRIDTEKGMYSEGSVHALVEAEKPHRLPVRAGGPGEQVARVPPGDPQARGPGAGLWEGRGARASQLSREGARTLPAPSCSIWASADWKGPTHSGGGGGEGGWIFFTQSADSNANLSCPPTHTQTPDMSFSPATWASP